MNDNFSFPVDARDKIDQMLRQGLTEDGTPKRLQSVRPERQRPVMTNVEVTNPTVNVVTPPPTPKADPEGISIDLPSKFFYYDFKDLYVKPFRVSHLAKVNKAHETSSIQTMAEVVSSVLSTSSGDSTDIAFRLTMADFNAVLYWLRMHSFGKPQMRITSDCTNHEHIEAVQQGLKTKESLRITTIYKESDMQFKYLTDAPDPEFYKVELAGMVIPLRPETVADVIEFLDNPNWQDPEFQFRARIASVLGVNLSLGDRLILADDLSPDQGVFALKYADLVDNYGVVETVATKCMECGASGLVKIAVDAPSFLSPEF